MLSKGDVRLLNDVITRAVRAGKGYVDEDGRFHTEDLEVRFALVEAGGDGSSCGAILCDIPGCDGSCQE